MVSDQIFTFYHKVPSVPHVKSIQDVMFSSPFPSAFTEFWKRLRLCSTQKLVDEILLELATYERVQHISQFIQIESSSTKFALQISFHLLQSDVAAFGTRQHSSTRFDLIKMLDLRFSDLVSLSNKSKG